VPCFTLDLRMSMGRGTVLRFLCGEHIECPMFMAKSRLISFIWFTQDISKSTEGQFKQKYSYLYIPRDRNTYTQIKGFVEQSLAQNYFDIFMVSENGLPRGRFPSPRPANKCQLWRVSHISGRSSSMVLRCRCIYAFLIFSCTSRP